MFETERQKSLWTKIMPCKEKKKKERWERRKIPSKRLAGKKVRPKLVKYGILERISVSKNNWKIVIY